MPGDGDDLWADRRWEDLHIARILDPVLASGRQQTLGPELPEVWKQRSGGLGAVHDSPLGIATHECQRLAVADLHPGPKLVGSFTQ